MLVHLSRYVLAKRKRRDTGLCCINYYIYRVKTSWTFITCIAKLKRISYWGLRIRMNITQSIEEIKTRIRIRPLRKTTRIGYFPLINKYCKKISNSLNTLIWIKKEKKLSNFRLNLFWTTIVYCLIDYMIPLL